MNDDIQLKKAEIMAKIMEKGYYDEERNESNKKTKQYEEIKEERKSKDENQEFISKEEALQLIKEEAEKQIEELSKKLEESSTGKTEFAAKPEYSREHEPDFDEKEKVVLTSKQIVDKGNYLNIKRLAMLIAQAADLIIGEFSEAQSVVAPEINELVKKYSTFLQEFISRLP